MSTDWRGGFFDQDPGRPQALQRGPDAAVVKAAGCPKAAKALEHALQLRDEYAEVSRQLGRRDAELRAAQAADAEAHAKDLGGKLEPVHVAEHEQRFAALARRHAALKIAVPGAVDKIVEALDAERETATVDLDERRLAILGRMVDAIGEVHAAYDQLQFLHDSVAWVRHWPADRRWRAPLAPRGSIRVGPARELTVGQMLAGMDTWLDALAALPLPGDEPEPTPIIFGRAGLGVTPAAAEATIKTS